MVVNAHRDHDDHHHHDHLLPRKRMKKTRYLAEKKKEEEEINNGHDSLVGDGCVLTRDLLVSEILSRLPVKVLLRLQTVCKAWRNLISSPRFITLQQNQTKKRLQPPQFLIAPLLPCWTNQIAFYTFDEHPAMSRLLYAKHFFQRLHGVRRPQHCNGLILYSSLYQLDIFNLSTKKSITLPPGAPSFHWPNSISPCRAALGFIRNTNTYKVAQFFYRSLDVDAKSCSVGLEVFTLGSSSSWTVVAEDPPYPIDYCRPVAVGEYIYLRVADANDLHHSSFKTFFISFNISDEQYREVILPAEITTGQNHVATNNMGFVELNDNLCFMCGQGRKQDVWICKEDYCTRPCQWIHIYSIDLLRPADFFFPIVVHLGNLLFAVEDGVVSAACYYDPSTKSLKPLVQLDIQLLIGEHSGLTRSSGEYSYLHVFLYVESLARVGPPKLMT